MREASSLFSLCVESITVAILHGCDYVQDVFELPSCVLDSLIMNLPSLALENIYDLSVNGCDSGEITMDNIKYGRKRGRYDNFNLAWEILYRKRWPKDTKNVHSSSSISMQNAVNMCQYVDHIVDWQQLYWEAHLQNCLDEAAERALCPGFDGSIGKLIIPDIIINSIGYHGATTHDCLKLSYHCNRFGRYARYLRFQNVLCTAEICELLQTSKLHTLIFRGIKSETHVNGVCMLLSQNWETLLSVEFSRCQLSPISVNQICNSIYRKGSHIHGIHNFCIKSSAIFGSRSDAIPSGLVSFLSSGRSLHSVCFSDTHMGPKFAKIIFDALLESSSALVTLEISDNDIAGWFPKIDRRSTGSSSVFHSDISLKSLIVLNLRENNFCQDDAEDLSNVLCHLPKLRSLDISDNPIEDDGMRRLTPYFIKAFENGYPLSDIKINNCRLSGMGMGEFLRSISMFKEPLNIFSIADNDLGCSIAAPLAKFLGTSRVRELNIEDIELGPMGFQELEKEMPEKIELVYINISKNRGGASAARFISLIASQAPNLVSVNAGYNLMPPESLPVIHDALNQSKGKLERLDLTGNTLLYLSMYTSTLLEFQCRGKPIVVIPVYPSWDAADDGPSWDAYDDDP